MITLPYNTTDFAFTLDDVFINISTTTADTYFTLKLTVKYYDFYSTTQKTKVIDYKIPLFNQAQKFNIGRIVHRIMSNINNINNLVPQYNTALVDLSFQELKNTDNSVVDTTNYTGFKFIAGILPLKLENNRAFLNENKEASRVTPKGFINISTLIPAGNWPIEIFKNGSLINSYTLPGTNTANVFTEKLDMPTLGAQPGDVFKYSIKNTNLFKEIIVFPETNLSHHILFLDAFKLLSTLECTGEFIFNSKYKKIEHIYTRNLADVLEIIDIKKISTFTINTGWILKSDSITVDSLAESKKAWLFISNTEVIEMMPTLKKLTNIDSKKQLYSYKLEFKINKAYNAQNYTL